MVFTVVMGYLNTGNVACKRACFNVTGVMKSLCALRTEWLYHRQAEEVLQPAVPGVVSVIEIPFASVSQG